MKLPHVVGYDSPMEVIETIENAEIIVGIPSKNSAPTISYVIHNALKGLEKYFEGTNYAIIVCDGLSEDSTVDIVKALKNRIKELTIVPNIKSKGKGGALKTIFELVDEYSDAKALILVDSDLRSITPEWIALLGKGALSYGLVTPLYIRHKYDATITNLIARPLTTMLYAINIKQPIGGDFGLNRKLVSMLANSPLWNAHPWFYLFGVDIFVTHTALANKMKVAEAELKAKIHEAKDPSVALKGMFIEVTGALFTLIYEYEETWTSIKVDKIAEPPKISEPKVPEIKPWEVRISKQKIKEIFINGLKDYKTIYEKILDKNLLRKLYKNNTIENGIDIHLWINILISYAKAYKREYKTISRARILETLIPLWQGRLLNYVNEVEELEDEEARKVIDNECKEFFRYRNYLKNTYSSP